MYRSIDNNTPRSIKIRKPKKKANPSKQNSRTGFSLDEIQKNKNEKKKKIIEKRTWENTWIDSVRVKADLEAWYIDAAEQRFCELKYIQKPLV